MPFGEAVRATSRSTVAEERVATNSSRQMKLPFDGAEPEQLALDLQKTPSRPSWQASENDALAELQEFGFKEQVSFREGKEVAYGTQDSVRPDLYSSELKLSVDIKNYKISTAAGRARLVKNVVEQVGARAANLPPGTKQGLIIDARGQTIKPPLLQRLVNRISTKSNNLIDVEDIYVRRE